ncbi:hypothetical protein ACFL6U_21715 [Planctomycetota bacterium]
MQNDKDLMRSNSGIPKVSRRSFLKSTASVTLGSVVVGPSLAAAIAAKDNIALVVVPNDAVATAVPPTWALGELRKVIESQGATVRVVARLADATEKEFCVIVSGMNSPLAKSIINQRNISAPNEAESLCLVQSEVEGHLVLLAAGTDALGLVYALTELADRVSCLATGCAALEFTDPVIEQPASRIRSIMRQFCSEVEDKVWFYDRDFWRSYLTMLVTSRVNRLSFTMGMGYNSARSISDGYLLFPYPFFVAAPGYDVNAKGLSADERARNLAMLKFIGAEAARRGLRFQLGIWTLAFKWNRSPNATYQIEGLTDTTHADYCRDAMAKLLHEVPTITGLTFRVHSESGIPKGEKNFWETQFSAIAKCGRRVEIDMHAKNMEPETLELALATGQPTVISPKYCGEHLSLPYHQSAIREQEMVSPDKFTDTGTGVLIGHRGFTRYGYADTLAENRTWDVVFRIWPGTQRFLLNGDPATFAGYARSAAFCGAAGIDLCEPLDFKGRMGSGLAGGRCAYADASLAPHYDFEKYLYTYRLWGRLGYNPDTNPEVWRRALRREFGSAALAIENALAAVSRVLPLFTLAHAPSANCMIFWPEIYTNMPIADSEQKQPYSDTRQPKLFGNVSPFDPQLFHSPNEYAEALLASRATGKYSPLEVAQWLEDIASSVSMALAEARRQIGAAGSRVAFRRIEEDVLIQRGLALFFADKLRSAVLWHIHVLTGSRAAGEAAISRYTEGRNAWAAMAERAKAVYRSNITYGSRDMLHGHWLDRIPSFDEDIADLRKRLELPIPPASAVDPAAAERALKMAVAPPKRPTVAARHAPADQFHCGQALAIALDCGAVKPQRVTLHYRHVNQAERWRSVELTRTGNAYQGNIPAAYTTKRYTLQYYFEIETGPTEATLFPLLAADLANVPYYIVRRANG